MGLSRLALFKQLKRLIMLILSTIYCKVALLAKAPFVDKVTLLAKAPFVNKVWKFISCKSKLMNTIQIAL